MAGVPQWMQILFGMLPVAVDLGSFIPRRIFDCLNCFSLHMNAVGNINRCFVASIWKWQCIVNEQIV